MQEVNITYQENELDELFTLEGEQLPKITPYCEDTDKTLETQFYLSVTSPLIFTLVINIKDEKRRD
jgi:hypothetical protein